MANNIINLDFSVIKQTGIEEKYRNIGDGLMMVKSAKAVGEKFMHVGQAFRVDEARFICVVSGHARSIINMVTYELHAGRILLVPKNIIFEVEEMDESFDMQFFSFKDLQKDLMPTVCLDMELDDDELSLIREYMDLLWHVISQENFSQFSVKYIESALMAQLKKMYHNERERGTVKNNSRQQEILLRFLELVEKHAIRERTIDFYADKLCLTPNHLGATIRAASDRTVMQWVHRRILQQIKIELEYTTNPINEISEKLNFPNSSALSMFFKRETGMTPGEFRKKYNN